MLLYLHTMDDTLKKDKQQYIREICFVFHYYYFTRPQRRIQNAQTSFARKHTNKWHIYYIWVRGLFTVYTSKLCSKSWCTAARICLSDMHYSSHMLDIGRHLSYCTFHMPTFNTYGRPRLWCGSRSSSIANRYYEIISIKQGKTDAWLCGSCIRICKAATLQKPRSYRCDRHRIPTTHHIQ